MSGVMKIHDRPIGVGHPTYIIAELSGNHLQDFDRSVQLIRAAQTAGVDAVKLQTYTPDTITIDCQNKYFQVGSDTIWAGRSLYELYQQTYTPWPWHAKLQDVAHELGLHLFSTPFDATAVDFLESLQMPAYKIASFELPDHALLKKVAMTGKPVILSTGMASLEEITEAVQVLHENGCQSLALLKCTSAYPAPPEEMNLRTIVHLSDTLKVPVGLSDHTLGIEVPLAAVALGACIIEKHLVISRDEQGPDAPFSLEPDEFKRMVQAVRVTEKALGRPCYQMGKKESASRLFRRSLFITKNVKKGQTLTHTEVRAIRPGHGLAPKFLDQVIGRRVVQDIPRGTPVTWELVEKTSPQDA